MRKLPIRWQLSLSYAGIAMLAAVLLGAIMLTILRSFYIAQEQIYLQQNAFTVSMLFSQTQSDNLLSADTQEQLESFAFIFNAQVRLLDADGQVIADSGPPQVRAAISVGSRSAGDFTTMSDNTLFVAAAPPISPTMDTMFTVRQAGRVTSTFDAPILIQSSRGSPVTGWSIAVAGNELPSENRMITTQRSNQVVRQSYFDNKGNLLGTVELSNGPAYGRNIIRSVAGGWGIAAALAVVIAAAAGWWVSQRFNQPLASLTQTATQMAAGDLTARADITRQDEFGSLAHSFNRMADTIEAKVGTLRAFVADAAHEIHTPLTALRSNLELAEVQDALLQVERMDSLTRNLLDLSRLEADEPDVFDQPVDLSALLRELAEPYASRAEQAGMKFKLEIEGEPVRVRGSAPQLRTLVHNLLDNAIKFTPAGGHVTAHLGEVEEHVRLIISDTGIGIPPEDLPHLFSRFHRGRNAAAYPGNGLGLAIVRAIVDRHGADIRVRSQPGATDVAVEFEMDEQN